VGCLVLLQVKYVRFIENSLQRSDYIFDTGEYSAKGCYVLNFVWAFVNHSQALGCKGLCRHDRSSRGKELAVTANEKLPGC